MSGAVSHVPMIDWLDGQIELAASTMRQELGESSVCTLHKDGRVTGGLKYQEGRMSALAGVRRALMRGEPQERALTVAEERWSAEFEMRQRASSSSLIWVSYATGGLDAVREARETAEPGTH